MKKFLILVLTTGLLLSVPTVIWAQTDDTKANQLQLVEDQQLGDNFKGRLKEVRETIEERLTEAKAKSFEKRCEAIKTKIGDVASKNQSHSNRQDIVFEQWRTRIATLSAKISAAGIDTTQLEAYLEEFDTLINQNKADYQNYLAGLEDLSSADCTNSVDVFYENIQSARATRLLIIQDSKDAVKVIKDKIKTELLNIKTQLQATSDSNDEGGE